MKKLLTLTFLFLLSAACLTGYLTLNKRILEGSLKVIAGEQQIAAGELKLKQGKARLSSGERELSSGKKTYQQMNQAAPLEVASAVAMPVLIATVAVTKMTGDKVSEGEHLVAQGKEKIKAGEARLNAGKEELRQGMKRLDQAKWVRTGCALGSFLFIGLFLGLCFYWRPRARK